MGIQDANKKNGIIRRMKGQRVAIVAPIFILMIGLGLINWLIPGTAASTANHTPSTLESVHSAVSEATQATPASSLSTPPLLGLATPWGVVGLDSAQTPDPTSALPAATPLPLPTLPTDTAIQLLGPPGESRFQLDDNISFYWNWPLTLEQNQRFAVYLRTGGNEWFLGAVEQNNLGSSFYLEANPAEWVTDPAQYEWLVRLEHVTEEDAEVTGQILAESQARLLLLSGG